MLIPKLPPPLLMRPLGPLISLVRFCSDGSKRVRYHAQKAASRRKLLNHYFTSVMDGKL